MVKKVLQIALNYSIQIIYNYTWFRSFCVSSHLLNITYFIIIVEELSIIVGFK